MAVSPYTVNSFMLAVRVQTERLTRFWGYVHDNQNGYQYANCETQHFGSHSASPPLVKT